MNIHLIEEAAFQLCQEVEYQTHYIEKLRDCREDLTPEERLLLSLSIDKVYEIHSLLEEALVAQTPTPKKFWKFWK